jgi:hypothetical protein
LLECPKLVPDEVVDHGDLRRADLAQRDVQVKSLGIGEQVENSHVHHHTATAHDAELDKSQERGTKT